MSVTIVDIDQVSKVKKDNIDTTTTNEALITKVVAGDNISLSSTGVDVGTGDVTISSSNYNATGNTSTNPIITLNGLEATIAESDVILYSTSDFTGTLQKYTLPERILPLTDNITNYVYASYNSGNPRYEVTTDVTLINESNIVPINTILMTNGNAHFSHWDSLANGLSNKLHRRLVKTQRYARETGIVLSESLGNIIISEGIVWRGARAFTLDTVNSNGTNNSVWFFYYHSNSNWTFSTSTNSYNSTQYDDGTNLVSLNPNKVTINWIFRGIEDHNHGYYVLGNKDYKDIPTAIAETAIPALPTDISTHALLVGRIIVKNSVPIIVNVESSFDGQFYGTVINEHNNLSGLQGGTVDEYYHLTSSQINSLHSLSDATPLMNGTAAAGTATTAARGDHSHPSDSGKLSLTGGTITGTTLIKPTSNGTTVFQVQPAASTTPVFNVDTTNSRVGVGTNAPAFEIDAGGGTVRGTGVLAKQAGTVGLVSLSSGDGSHTGYISWRRASTDAASHAATRNAYLGFDAGAGLTLALENSSHFIISGGNVGIGTTSPAEKLSVLDTGNVSIGNLSVGTSGTNTIVMKSGTLPTTNSGTQLTGTASGLSIRDESGKIVTIGNKTYLPYTGTTSSNGTPDQLNFSSWYSPSSYTMGLIGPTSYDFELKNNTNNQGGIKFNFGTGYSLWKWNASGYFENLLNGKWRMSYSGSANTGDYFSLSNSIAPDSIASIKDTLRIERINAGYYAMSNDPVLSLFNGDSSQAESSIYRYVARFNRLGYLGIGTNNLYTNTTSSHDGHSAAITVNQSQNIALIGNIYTTGNSINADFRSNGNAVIPIGIIVGSKLTANGQTRTVVKITGAQSLVLDSAVDWSGGYPVTCSNPYLEMRDTTNSYFKVDYNGYVGVSTSSPTSTLHVNGSQTKKLSTISTNTTLDATHHIIAASGSTTITLPTAVGIPGREYIIKKTDSSNTITINTFDSIETIDGQISITLTLQYESLTLISSGSSWMVV